MGIKGRVSFKEQTIIKKIPFCERDVLYERKIIMRPLVVH